MMMVAPILLAAAAGSTGGSMETGSLLESLESLSRTGRVLYVGAHPDDENTRLLAYLAHGRGVEVAYLSLTRGGGGQNLIGTEQGALLGILRTEELLAARRLDGAIQRFTRAVDFGYSKTSAETLERWGRQEILADVVWVIRTFQPDVILTRFAPDGSGHGHHAASAELAAEAFSAAADPKQFPEQLERGATVWQADRLLRNVSHWRTDPKELKKHMALDVGAYDVYLGASYTEIAAKSRSMHKSQGFGSAGERGPNLEYFEPIAGTRPKRDILEGLDLGWRRFDGAEVERHLDAARAVFLPEAPERVLPHLLAAAEVLGRLDPSPRVERARDRIFELAAASVGLFAAAFAETAEVTPGGSVPVELEVLLRRPAAVTLEEIRWPDGTEQSDLRLEIHAPKRFTRAVAVPSTAPPSAPYWLAKPPSPGRYRVSNPTLIGLPEGPAPASVRLSFAAGRHRFELVRPVVHRLVDRVHGERRRRMLVVPPLTVTPASDSVVFVNGGSEDVVIEARAGKDEVSGTVTLALPSGWKATPASHQVSLRKAGDAAQLRFSVAPGPGRGVARPVAAVDGLESSWRRDLIDYPHVPLQVVLRPATVTLSPVRLTVPKRRIGYVMGSGDLIPEGLERAGFEVVLLSDEALRSGAYEAFDVLLLGIRALNTRDVLAGVHGSLMDWVGRGGTLITQYNTHSSWSPLSVPVGPFPLQLGRGRVTDEGAKVKLLEPKHPALSRPNRLTAEDFGGWVQERGLYFGESWDDRYRPLLAMKDPGEEEQRGALLVARHGDGIFVYTGLSLFRQLPAGVPGAYRLLANLIDLGSSK